MDYVDAHLDTPLTLAELAGVAALSTYHFARMFHTSFGEPPHAWVRARRIERARPCWPPARATWPASRRPAASAAPAICRGSSATRPASRRASIAAPAPDAEPARISPMGTARRGPAPLWQPGPNLPMPLDDASRRPLREYWLAEIIRLRETHWGPLEDAEAVRARAPRAACRTASWSAPTGSPTVNNCPPSSRAGPAAPWPCWPRCSRWRCSPASAWPWARWATARGPSTCCGRWAPCWACTR